MKMKTQAQRLEELTAMAEKLVANCRADVREMEDFLKAMRARPLSRPETRVIKDAFQLVLCKCGQPAERPMQSDVGLESGITHMCVGCADDYLNSLL